MDPVQRLLQTLVAHPPEQFLTSRRVVFSWKESTLALPKNSPLSEGGKRRLMGCFAKGTRFPTSELPPPYGRTTSEKAD